MRTVPKRKAVVRNRLSQTGGGAMPRVPSLRFEPAAAAAGLPVAEFDDDDDDDDDRCTPAMAAAAVEEEAAAAAEPADRFFSGAGAAAAVRGDSGSRSVVVSLTNVCITRMRALFRVDEQKGI
jgi:hypothetical protein